jgi:hypothetical protein
MALFSLGESFAWSWIGDAFCDLALNSENVGQIAIVILRPEMRVRARVDQLRVYSHAIANALNTSFHDMRDAKFISLRCS